MIQRSNRDSRIYIAKSSLHATKTSSEDIAAGGLSYPGEAVATVAADMDLLIAAAEQLLDLELGLHASIALAAHKSDGGCLEGDEWRDGTVAMELHNFGLSNIGVLHSSR